MTPLPGGRAKVTDLALSSLGTQAQARHNLSAVESTRSWSKGACCWRHSSPQLATRPSRGGLSARAQRLRYALGSSRRAVQGLAEGCGASARPCRPISPIPIPRRSNTQDASKARQEDLWEMFTANFEAMQISDLPSAGDHRMLNAPSWCRSALAS